MQRVDTAWPPRAGKPCSGGEIRSGPAGDTALILGAIIAGGAARRFGCDKALALLGGVRLIDHAAAAIAPFVDATVVCGGARDGYAALADLPGPGFGPLGGIAAALVYGRDNGFDRVLTIACDMPSVPEGLLRELIATAPSYCSDAPILGCWPAMWGGELASYLCAPAKAGAQTGLPPSREHKDPRWSIRGWINSTGARGIETGADLPNINTPADLATL